MKNVKRIAIIGNAGSGKSTLATRLHAILSLPVYHLDQYYWKPYWTRSNPDKYKIVHDMLCEQDQWIIDGINLKLLEYRIQRAEVIIFLDFPRYICFWRIFKRTFTYWGKETPYSAKECREGFSLKFIKFLKWVWDFKAQYQPKIYEFLNIYGSTKKVYVFKSHNEVEQLVSTLKLSNNLEKL